MKKTVYIEVTTTDPTFNLALEEYVFERMPRDREYFITWRNDNAIIIGRHQNTLSEINLPFVQSRGIQVVRRLSGGGAVYHDLGNLNFTFIVDAAAGQQVDLRRFCEPIAQVLRNMGATATVDGRNDILIDGKKISGNAQYVRQGRVMHHGTILFDSDTTVLSQALQVDPSKIQSKGVKSVRSRVTTVRPCLKQDMDMAGFRKALTAEILQNDACIPYTLTAEDIEEIKRIQAARYAQQAWNYGTDIPCSLIRKGRIEGCGTLEVRIAMENDKIEGLFFCGDYFSTLGPEGLARRFVGLPLTEEAFRTALTGCTVSDYITGLTPDALLELIFR